MNNLKKVFYIAVFLIFCFSVNAKTSEHTNKKQNESGQQTCKKYGPQAPRNIDKKTGKNKLFFSLAPKFEYLNLCNIHFHTNAEHKAKDFSIYAGEGKHGHRGGYQCLSSMTLTKKELFQPGTNYCEGVKSGDTIEVHWVYSSCNVEPGKGLTSCLSEKCTNPELRVEAQVFTVVNDELALNFNTMTYDGNIINGYHQAKSLPVNTGKPIEFIGSTTGPKYTEQNCSPLQVTWRVRPKCEKININSLSQWCKSNIFKENHAHGVRKLITRPELLSEIK